MEIPKTRNSGEKRREAPLASEGWEKRKSKIKGPVRATKEKKERQDGA